ncbi:Sodium Bile acid symporter family [Porphyromonas macacae]|uniref:Sodium Bile acid symporter family n=1 Tax=Porphyromonas macacae TaxID=28115 RepID=A0A379DIX7_9PORP|nr:hypothetical protein [Porphyromonas macacae]SUB77914.1 Sodium Bile acid symporter family [Porphyromonas macacae]
MRPPHNFLRRAKDYGLPIAMTFGVLLWEPLSRLEFCIPYLIFGMLFITFLKLKISQLQFNVWHIVLLSIQMISAVGSYYLLLRSNPVLASGTMICFLAPCATASAVIIGMLGGSIAFSTPYVLLSHLVLAFTAPILFSTLGAADTTVDFWQTVWYIFKGVIPLVIFPLLAAQLLRYVTPGIHRKLASIPQAAFYLWIISLAIILAKTTKYAMLQPKENIHTEILLAMCGLLACTVQFIIGKLLGRKIMGEPITMGQSLGQKNTTLAIWISLTYLNPLSSIAPASYIIWQNSLNSIQLWNAGRKADRSKQKNNQNNEAIG